MDLFGLEEVLESPGQVLFIRNTKQYIEWFYNDYEGPRNSIRGQVLDVRAVVRVSGQVEGTAGLNPPSPVPPPPVPPPPVPPSPPPVVSSDNEPTTEPVSHA